LSTPASLRVDHALSARLDAAQAAQIEGVNRAVAARLPGLRVALASLAGGRAGFVAPQISLSRAAGLGMCGPVTAADVEALEALYHSRGTQARILVSPYAHPSLIEHLAGRGFLLEGLDTVLVRRFAPAESFIGPDAVTVRVSPLDEAADRVRTSLEGFLPPGETAPAERIAIFEAASAWPDATFFTASLDGEAAGTGAVQVHEGVAHFFATSTVARHRGRGVQAALIQARLAFARDAGCDLAFACTEPGSGSQRNFERAGFASVYSQAILIKPLPGGTQPPG
jgi:GNAT superfamily N-acetyltransferase